MAVSHRGERLPIRPGQQSVRAGRWVTARVYITGETAQTHEPCDGTIPVAATTPRTLRDLIQAAMDYVSAGGIRWGKSGSQPCIPHRGEIVSVSRGEQAGAPVRITNRGVTMTLRSNA